MGSPCALHLHGAAERVEPVARAAQQEVARLERKYTRYRDDSLTAQINRSAGDPDGVEVDAETAALLDYADAGFRTSGGLFDLTSGVLRRVWDFRSGRVPTREQVDAVRRLVGWERVRWQRPRLVLPQAGMQLDFGGVVKEYAADRAAELCRRLGVRHGLVDLGGDLCAIGPHPDGSAWVVGIRHPREPGATVATLLLSWGGIATSGDYERAMLVDGVRYGHILDPRSGWPVEGLAAASVVAPRCVIAGTAATVAMLEGETEGAAWLEGLGLPYLAVRRDGVASGPLAPRACSRGSAVSPGARPAGRPGRSSRAASW